MTYYLSSIFGLARGHITKKVNGTYTLHIDLTPRHAFKIAGYLTQSGHKNQKDALRSWYGLRDRLEIELSKLN